MNVYEKIESVSKGIGVILLAISISYGFWQYSDRKEKEFKIIYWDSQIEIYLETSLIASSLVKYNGSQKDKRAAESAFWSMYYGPMAIVEDADVETAMVAFGRCLEITECKAKQLAARSLDLSAAMRRSIGNTWNLRLAVLERSRLEAN